MPRPLALLLVAAGLLSAAWALVLPPLQGPDEPQHVNYAQHLAETGERPSFSLSGTHPDSTQTGSIIVWLNLSQLAGDYASRPAWSEADQARMAKILAAQPASAEADGSGPNALGRNPPGYYALQAGPYAVGSLTGDPFGRLLVMRLLGAVLLMITVALTWLIAAELFRATWVRVVAAGCVALLPQLGFLSGVVNADNLLVCAWTAFVLAAVRLTERGFSAWRVLGLCAAVAVSLLTHGRGVAIVPALLAVVLLALARHRPGVGVALRALVPGAALLALAVVGYRVLLPPEEGAYGGELTTGGQPLRLSHFLSWTWQFYFPRLGFMNLRPGDYGYREVFIESFFGKFGSLEIAYDVAIYDLIQRCAFVGLVALAVALVLRVRSVGRHWATFAALAATGASMVGLLHLASFRALVNSADPLITGRYLLPLASLFGLAVAFVLASLPRRLGVPVAGAVLGGLVALHLGGLALTLARFYA